MTYKHKWFLGLEEFRLLIDRSVATYAAMKSGLKVKCATLSIMTPVVATYAAMKSGLKELCAVMRRRFHDVATYAAMKSGLKDAQSGEMMV